MDNDVAEAKARLRHRICAERAARPDAQRAADARAVAEHVLELPELREAATVAAYESFGTEPATRPLLNALRERGHRVLLPVLLPDRDLAWIEPPDPGHLGVDAITHARVVLCPGLAADSRGARLGRGGGSYDRALARCPTGTLRVLLLHDDELLERVPTAPHDQPVDIVVTPTRILRLR